MMSSVGASEERENQERVKRSGCCHCCRKGMYKKQKGLGDLMVGRRWSKGKEEREREDAINLTDGLMDDGTNQG